MKKKDHSSINNHQITQEEVANMPDVCCLECGCKIFRLVVTAKYLSPLVNKKPEAAFIVSQTYSCLDCHALLPTPDMYMTEKFNLTKGGDLIGEPIGEEEKTLVESSDS